MTRTEALDNMTGQYISLKAYIVALYRDEHRKVRALLRNRP